MREKKLPLTCRGDVDKEFHKLLLEDGMWEWRADIWYKAVKGFALYAAKPKKPGEVLVAP